MVTPAEPGLFSKSILGVDEMNLPRTPLLKADADRQPDPHATSRYPAGKRDLPCAAPSKACSDFPCKARRDTRTGIGRSGDQNNSLGPKPPEPSKHRSRLKLVHKPSNRLAAVQYEIRYIIAFSACDWRFAVCERVHIGFMNNERELRPSGTLILPGGLFLSELFSPILSASRIVAGILLIAAYGGLSGAKVTLAAVQDSRFECGADADTADLHVNDVSRCEVLERLFAGTDIKLKWLSSSFGEEAVSGKLIGSCAAVARQLLQEANFIIGQHGREAPIGEDR